jgi:PBP1b-binding outer membrane lipoprotein LpoB
MKRLLICLLSLAVLASLFLVSCGQQQEEPANEEPSSEMHEEATSEAEEPTEDTSAMMEEMVDSAAQMQDTSGSQ